MQEYAMSRNTAYAGDQNRDDAADWNGASAGSAALSALAARRAASVEQRFEPCLELDIPRQRVLANLGVRKNQRISARLNRQIEHATITILEEATPRCVHRTYPIDRVDGHLRIDGRLTFQSSKLAQGLGWCHTAHVYLATLGADVDRAIDAAMNDRPDFGMVVDTVASVAAEILVDEIEQALSDRLLPNEALSLPFSPGYCDWHVCDQQVLLGLLPAEQVGVSLSDSSLMKPRKSISGILGVGYAHLLEETRNPCVTCKRRNCLHKRHRTPRKV
jgi:hypothetical protein